MQLVDVRGGPIPKRQIIWSVIHFLPRDEHAGQPRRKQSASFLKVSRDGGHVSISHALVMTVTSRKRTIVVNMRNHNPKEEVMDPVMKQYEAPQLIDLEDEVGCDALCATGGDSAPIVQAPS